MFFLNGAAAEGRLNAARGRRTAARSVHTGPEGACDATDTSRKFMTLKSSNDGQIATMWSHDNVPPHTDKNVKWNFFVHVECGGATERAFCLPLQP